MYELIVLSLLTRAPMHGYLIARIINSIIGPYARLSNGRLYPLLAKLEAEGLITAAGDEAPRRSGGRHQRTFCLTDEGRERFHQLMLDTTSNPGEYDRLFWQKVPYLEQLSPEERIYLIDHFMTYCQAHVFHLRAEASDLERRAVREGFMTPERLDTTLFVMRHAQGYWELNLDHARALREREGGRVHGDVHNEDTEDIQGEKDSGGGSRTIAGHPAGQWTAVRREPDGR